jgi:hypothetical protein
MTAKTKSLILGILVLVDSFFFWYFLKRLLYGDISLTAGLIWTCLAFVELSVYVGLLFFMERNKWYVLIPMLLSALISFIAVPVSSFGLVLLAFILFILSYQRIRRAIKYHLRIRPVHILSRGWFIYFLGFALLVSVAYFHSPGLEPEVVASSTLELSREIVKFIPIASPEVIELTLNTIREQITVFFAESPFAQFIPIGLAASLFLSIIGLNFVFYWLTGLSLVFIIWLLKKVKIISEETEECQRIIIKF